MASPADMVASRAEEELGYLEKSRKAYQADPSVLDRKTDGAGADNLTKYARDTKHPNGYAWCQTFVTYILMQCFGYDLANKLLGGMAHSAYTLDVLNAMRKKGREIPLSQASRGDIVYRSRSGGGHVGIVVGRQGGKIITVEGNSSSSDITSWNGGAVVRHVDAPWQWCVRPDYSIVPKYTPETWYKDDVGWWYAKTAADYAKSEWLDINHHRYYFDEAGYAVEGVQNINGKSYVFETKGNLECALMITGKDDSLRYKEV